MKQKDNNTFTLSGTIIDKPEKCRLGNLDALKFKLSEFKFFSKEKNKDICQTFEVVLFKDNIIKYENSLRENLNITLIGELTSKSWDDESTGKSGHTIRMSVKKILFDISIKDDPILYSIGNADMDDNNLGDDIPF